MSLSVSTSNMASSSTMDLPDPESFLLDCFGHDGGVNDGPSPLLSVNSSVPRNKNAKTALPRGFEPGPYTVVCGRGKACSAAPGNKHLKSLVGSYLQPYSQAKNKLEKSGIVSTIVNLVKQASQPHGPGTFVKFDAGVWWEVEDGVAREKVGCLLRDCLHSQYRSSTKSKLARRRARKAAATPVQSKSFRNPSAAVAKSQREQKSRRQSMPPTPVAPVSTPSLFSEDILAQDDEDLEPLPSYMPSNSNNSCAPRDPFTVNLGNMESCSSYHRNNRNQQQVLPTKLLMQDYYASMSNSNHGNNDCMPPPTCSSADFRPPSSSRSSMAMSTYFDIMGNNANNNGMNFPLHNSIQSALEEACDILSCNEDEDDDSVDLPDDFSNIFDE